MRRINGFWPVILLLLLGLMIGCEAESDGGLLDGDVATDGDEAVDGDENTDGDGTEVETDGDMDGDMEGEAPADGDGIDGDIDGDADGDAEVEQGEQSAVVITNTVVVLDRIAIDSGMDLDGDGQIDNAVAGLEPETQILNAAIEAQLNNGLTTLVLRFVGLTELPAPGADMMVDVEAIYALDSDDDPTDNFTGETFTIDPLSYDDQGEWRIFFEDVLIESDPQGVVTMTYEKADFAFGVKSSLFPDDIQVSINNFKMTAVLSEDDAKPGHLKLSDGLFAGIIPHALLEQYGAAIEDVAGFDPAETLALYVDMDLNGDETVSTDAAGNPDGLSVGAVVSGVYAYIDEGDE